MDISISIRSHSERGYLDHAEEIEILNEIGRRLLAWAPQGWSSIIYTSDAVVDHSTGGYRVENEQGDNIADWGPTTLGLLLDDLRAGMYREGEGTWFSIKYIITRLGKFHVEYNYTEAPCILFPTAWGYTNDLKRFPRKDKYIPDWLRQKVSEEPLMQSE